MKKIFISLLMVAASLSAFAVTYTGKAKLTLTSSDNKSCTLGIAESADLSDGLNSGYYAELNEEGRDILFYVTYGGKNYQQFASSPATMQDLQLGIKTNASTAYTLTASGVTGSLKIKINGVEYTITAGMNEAITLPASSTLPAAGDEDNYKVQPSAPATPQICFEYETLKLTKYAGATVEVFKKGETAAAIPAENVPSDAMYSIDLSALAKGQYEVKVTPAGATEPEKYIIDIKPLN